MSNALRINSQGNENRTSENGGLSFETLFLNFAEKYYTDSQKIEAKDKNIFLKKLNIPTGEFGESAYLFNQIYFNLNSDFQKGFAINRMKVTECKTANGQPVSRKKNDSIFPMMVIDSNTIKKEEKISKIVNELMEGETEKISAQIDGCHSFTRCTAKLKKRKHGKEEICKNPSLKSKDGHGFGDFCGRHIPPRTKGKWSNISKEEKKLYSADNIYQTKISYNPIGESFILEFNVSDKKTEDFKLKLEHNITIQVGKHKQKYNLVGLIFYISSSHYVAHIKRGKTWYLVDDSISTNLKEIEDDKVFKYNNNPPYMIFYTKGNTRNIKPGRLLQTGNTCYFDCLMDTILGLESVRKWVHANSKNNTRQERHTRRIQNKRNTITKKLRSYVDRDDDDGDGNGDGDGDVNGDVNGDGNGNGDGDDRGDENNSGNRNSDGDRDNKDNNKREICDNKISFTQRKTGNIDCSLNVLRKNLKIGMYDKYNYGNSGRQYVAADPVFQVQGQIKRDHMYLPNTIYQSTTYIYIISKTINGETFYKIGEGGKGPSNATGTGRLGNAQTYLIPGSIDAGFLVHYLMFFRKNYHIDSKYIGQHVEKQIHATLQTLFPAASISFANNNASEWYSIKDTERNFFFGFVFDIIGSFQETRMKPLEITRISPKSKEDEEVYLPSSEEIVQRMKLTPEGANVLQIVNTFNLRYIRPHSQIFIDRNNPDDVKSYVEQLKKIYINQEDTVTLVKPIFKEIDTFNVIEIKKHVHAWQKGLSNRLIYATVKPLNNKTNITEDKAIRWLDNKKNNIYYVDIHLFLENLHPFGNQSAENKKKLESIYEYFKNQYEKHQSEVPLPVQVFPVYFLGIPFQDKCGNKFVQEDAIGKYHDDYSIEIEQNTDEHEDNIPENQIEDEVTNQTEILYSWKVMNYKNQMIWRKRWNKETSTVFGDEEVIPVLRLMKIADVQEMKNVKVKKGPKNPWRKLTWTEVEEKKITIDGESYEPGDTVLIDDSQFLKIVNDMPSTASDKRLTYLITGFFNDSNLDTTLNPLIVVKEKKKGERIKRDQESIYTSANPDIISGHIDMHTKGRLTTPVEPKYNHGNVIQIINMKDFYDDILPFSQNIDLAKKWSGVHYVKIIHLTKNYYGVSFFPPYDTPTYWESGQSQTYIIDIRIEKFERHSKLIDANDSALNIYKNKLPFQITGIEVINSHLPFKVLSPKATRGTVEGYNVKWAAPNGIVIEPHQSKENMEKFAKAQVDLYWQKKSTPIDAYNADHIENGTEKEEFARNNVQMIIIKNSNNKDNDKQRAFSLTIDTNSGFKIGDIFIINDVFNFLCYFTRDLDSTGPSIKYGLCENGEKTRNNG